MYRKYLELIKLQGLICHKTNAKANYFFLLSQCLTISNISVVRDNIIQFGILNIDSLIIFTNKSNE